MRPHVNQQGKEAKDLKMLFGGMIRKIMFKIGKEMVKNNQDIIGDQYKRNDDVLLAVGDGGKKIAEKSNQ